MDAAAGSGAGREREFLIITDIPQDHPELELTLTEHAYAEQLLWGETLADKLVKPIRIDLVAEAPKSLTPTAAPSFPGRPVELRRNAQSKQPFPKAQSLNHAHARGLVLHYFANHELLALELMALALLRFPDAPPAFRQGLVRTMQEEQSHLRLYLARMRELGVQFGDIGVSDFFWNALHDMANPLAFVAGMSLTLEQANLDFSRHYRDQFAAVGDAETAALMERVYREEIGHVKHGLIWFTRWRAPETSNWTAYALNLKLPLSPARAKAAPFDAEGRRAAGFDEDFISRLDLYGGSKGRPPDLYWYNPTVEIDVAQMLTRHAPSPLTIQHFHQRTPAARHLATQLDGELLPSFLAKTGDIVFCRQDPAPELLHKWRDLGFSLPEFVVTENPTATVLALAKVRPLGSLQAWGIAPATLRLQAELTGTPLIPESAAAMLRHVYAKTNLPELRRNWREQNPSLAAYLGPSLMDGRVVRNMTELKAFASSVSREMACDVLIKAPFSAAGRERLRLTGKNNFSNSQNAWLTKAWSEWGELVAEPLVEVVADGSLLRSVPQGDIQLSHFQCDARGQYQGHLIGAHGSAGLSAMLHRLQPSDPAAPKLSGATLKDIATCAFAFLDQAPYAGRAGLDFFIYRLPGLHTQGRPQLFLQAIGEINGRTTMGHLALAIGARIAPGIPALWTWITQSRTTDSLAQLGHAWQEKYPVLQERQPTRRMQSGIFFTNDPKTAQHGLGVVAVGKPAMAAVSTQALAATSESKG